MNTRRTFSPTFKTKIVLALVSGTKTQSELCREHQLSPALLSHWRAEFLEHASLIFEREDTRSQDAQRVAELERLVGRLTLELDISKKASVLFGAMNGVASSAR